MALDRRALVIAVLAVLTATATGVAAGAVLGGPDSTIGRASAPSETPDPTPSSPISGRATATRIPAPLPAGPGIPVYVLGDTGAGPRLYREFRPGAAGDPVRRAVTGLAEPPTDPDYRTPWLGVPVSRLTRSGADVTVQLARPPRLSAPREATVAVQQVVHTVTAADTTVQRVRVLAPGLPAALTAAAVGRAGQLDVLAPVWLLSPVDGGRTARRVVLSGTAAVFEATVSIEVRKGAEVVVTATATATVGAPERGEWTAAVTLPPGDYVLAAYEVSAKDGSRLAVDTKRVTVT